MRLSYVEDKEVRTTVTNGTSIRYNPSFIENLPIKQIATVIAHEVLHISSLHHLRRANRDKAIWNKAADYAINPLLKKAKFQLPDDALLDDRFQNMSAERIYAILKKEDISDG